MKIQQPDYRIKVENLGEWSIGGVNTRKFVTHGGQGCPKMGLIEIHDDSYLRCCYCGTPLTDEAATHIMANIGKKFMETTTTGGKRVFAWM